MGVSSWMRGSSPRMTQSVWRGQSVTVDPASVAPRLKEVIAGLNRQSSSTR